ncbi:hypothetical protein ACFX13_006496 [Malus domestica]
MVHGMNNSNKGGVGSIIRDDQGSFVAAAAKKLEHVYSPLQAEALAARDGLLLATQRETLPLIRPIIEDLKALIASATGASSSHVCHQAHGIAHCLARTGHLSGTNCNWERVPPDLISDLLLEEAVL